jgi:hypothetical protein
MTASCLNAVEDSNADMLCISNIRRSAGNVWYNWVVMSDHSQKNIQWINTEPNDQRIREARTLYTEGHMTVH